MTQSTQLSARISPLNINCFHPDTLPALEALCAGSNPGDVAGLQLTYARDARDGHRLTRLGEVSTWTHLEDGIEKTKFRNLADPQKSAMGLALAHLMDDPSLETMTLSTFWDLPAETIRWGAICVPQGVILLRGVAELGLRAEDDAAFQEMVEQNCIVVLHKTGSAHEKLAALNALQDILSHALVDEDWQRSLRTPGVRRPAPKISLSA